MNIIRKLITGSPKHISRLHTEDGSLVSLPELKWLPICAYQLLRTRVTGRRPDVPWWPLAVIPEIESLLGPESDVIEFGSGSSTVWLAQRSRSVITIEDNSDWADRVTNRLAITRTQNARIYERSGTSYYDLSDFAGQTFDLAVIDGSYRWKCVEAVLPMIAGGGAVYLDNSDADKDSTYYTSVDQSKLAQSILSDYASRHRNAVIEKYISFLSGELQVGEGMLLRLP